MKGVSQFLSVWRRRVVAWARAFNDALAEPGPLKTDAFRREETVFQRIDVRRPR